MEASPFSQLVFDDPSSSSRMDQFEGEERWQTTGHVGMAAILVVHTAGSDDQSGRIITARNATRIERKLYEEGEF